MNGLDKYGIATLYNWRIIFGNMLFWRLDLIKWKRRPFKLFLCCSLNLLLTPIHEKQGIAEIVWYSVVICYK